MLAFKSLLNYPKGTLESILIEAYAPFHECYPEYSEENFKILMNVIPSFMKILK